MTCSCLTLPSLRPCYLLIFPLRRDCPTKYGSAQNFLGGEARARQKSGRCALGGSTGAVNLRVGLVICRSPQSCYALSPRMLHDQTLEARSVQYADSFLASHCPSFVPAITRFRSRQNCPAPTSASTSSPSPTPLPTACHAHRSPPFPTSLQYRTSPAVACDSHWHFTHLGFRRGAS